MYSNVKQVKSFYKNRQFSGFSSLNGVPVRFSIKLDNSGFDFIKSLCLVLLRPVEISLMLSVKWKLKSS